MQPLADMDGKMNLDDAVFFFGQQDDWKIKIGRFEARDMFPLNQDTFIEYSGNTANDLYSDGYGYALHDERGRGRSSSGGNLLFSKTVDNWYFEVNTLVGGRRVRCLSIRTIMVTRWKTAKMWCTCGRWRRGSPAPGRRPRR